jgi:hypothetical protein
VGSVNQKVLSAAKPIESKGDVTMYGKDSVATNECAREGENAHESK